MYIKEWQWPQLEIRNWNLFDSFLLLTNNPNSTFTQKLEVLKALQDICADGNTTVSLFLNYDCSDEAGCPKVFQRIISTIENIGQSKLESRDWINQEEADDLKHAALSCFVKIMEGLLQWKETREKEEHHLDNREDSQSKSQTILSQDLYHNDDYHYSMGHLDNSTILESASKSATIPDKDIYPPPVTAITASASSLIAPTITATTATATTATATATTTTTTSQSHSIHKINSYQEKFERHTKQQATLKTGVVKFNIKPSQGIKYLMENGFLNDDPTSIAEFLLTQSQLSKIQIGEYLGGEKPLNQKVMHEYINRIQLANMDFVDALRVLCASFFLPGEGQKIDRILQRFADRYCEDNPDVFPNADIAYILAYSCILLHVNVHSPKVKKKMTKEEFVLQTKGATKDETLSAELLSHIYDNIVAKEMKLPGHDDVEEIREKEDKLSSRQKLDLLRVESRRMIRDIKKKIKMTRQQKTHEKFISVHDVTLFYANVCKLMFSASWMSALATFGVVFETNEVSRHIKSCLRGYRCCIRLAGQLDMDIECDAFVNSLARFTLLGTLQAMKNKNVEAIQLSIILLHQIFFFWRKEEKRCVTLAYYSCEGDHLRSSWAHILRCISEIEVLFLMSSNAVSDAHLYTQANQFTPDHPPTIVKQGSHLLTNVPEAITHEQHSIEPTTSTGASSNAAGGTLVSTSQYEQKMLQSRTRMGQDGILRFQGDFNARLVTQNVEFK
ncbi:hypothetical protein RFI_13236 [Reticulomyxa filosa]|uniref:SEC7 domain-containing protein n=1 Tax=Reticulomyxa filosa TaxID=46433 RepID=X6ND86_RETFI|nr:hypothetical protein RFI_13236 [Reticulomyxa filosa]|eukprot:ETO23926.1 hypothetical protein RFI_13236 [Reticulomyxa filosa]